MTTNVVETESTTAVVTENDITSVVEVTSAGPAGPPGGALTIQDEGVDEGLLTDKINFAGSTVSVVNDTEAEIATVTVNAADPGANTNITSLGGITGGISSPDYVQFDTAAAAAGAVGRLLWNDTDGTLEFQMKGGNVTLQIGQEEVIRVTNKAGVTMTDGQAVYITGSTGNHLNVTLAQANAEATSSKTLAVVTETIANNNTGFATSSGLVRGLNTSALTEGAAIWLSPTVPGGLTSTKPVAPNHAVLIGWCVRQHASVGVIYVHIANGYELEELHNVLITAAANNQVLRYDAATGLWKNATISPTLTLTGDVSGSATFADLGNATLTATVADDSHNHIISNVDGLQDALDSKLPAASYTAADVLTKIKTVDGTGSGLDADLLDGQDGAHYLDFTNATNKPDPTITLAGDATGSVTLTDLTSGTLNVTVVDDSHNHVISNVDGLQDALDAKLPSASYTAADVLDKIKTVDGAGSGLDADLLDGQSSAYYTAINDRLGYTAENAANKGVAGGYASLDGAGLVPATQLPSYVDDVLEFANLAAFPVTGETGKIYVAVDTSKTYRWSGSTYVEISASPGSTDAVPEGSTNLYFTTARARQSVSAGTGIGYNSSTGVITNSAPDQTVAITGSGTTTVTGTYPNFTVSSADQYVGTVTSVSGTGTVNGLTLTGTVTSSGSLTLGGTLSVDLSTATVTGTLPVTKGGTGVTSLTSNYLVKGNGTSAISASSVYDNGSSVAIGSISSGSSKFYVYDANASISTNEVAAGGTGVASSRLKYSTNHYGIYVGSVNAMVFYDYGASAERMRIDGAGNLGIGTTTPASKLDVNGQITVPDQLAYDYTTSVLPDITPALNLNFVQSGVVDPRITFTRSSTATFVGSNGLIQTAAVNAPRLDYDPVTRAPKGLLIEEQRTNLLLQSQFASGWSFNANASFNATPVAAPDGTSTARVLNDTSASTNGYAFQGVSMTSGLTYTMSVFVKRGTLRFFMIRSFTQVGVGVFDLSTNTVSEVSGVVTSATITNFGNGWYRCTATMTANATASNNIGFGDYELANTGDICTLWGAQLEAGAFATSYIPTVASQVTRSVDVATMTGTNFSSWYRQDEGTIVANADTIATTGTRSIMAPSTGGNFLLYISNFNYAGEYDGTNLTLTANQTTQNTAFKAASSYGSGGMSVVLNNGTVATGSYNNAFAPIVAVFLGTNAASAALNGHIRSIQYYNTRLANTVLQGITA